MNWKCILIIVYSTRLQFTKQLSLVYMMSDCVWAKRIEEINSIENTSKNDQRWRKKIHIYMQKQNAVNDNSSVRNVCINNSNQIIQSFGTFNFVCFSQSTVGYWTVTKFCTYIIFMRFLVSEWKKRVKRKCGRQVRKGKVKKMWIAAAAHPKRQHFKRFCNFRGVLWVPINSWAKTDSVCMWMCLSLQCASSS